VIPNADQEAASWYRRTGAYPVNHVLCLKTSLRQAHPWLTDELFRLCVAAKESATEPSAEARWASLVGADPLPYGMEANRTGIDYCLRYAAEQGLVPRILTAPEVFAG
jgi:4,5-dihydroxyphthalate decarboxylase